MRRFVPLLLLSSLPSLVHAGSFQLSPATLTVDNGQSSPTIELNYTPSPGAYGFEISISIGLERLGWSRVEPADSPDPSVNVACVLSGGKVRGLVYSSNGGSLPATTFPICRLRVRPHAHTNSQSWYTISATEAWETDVNFQVSPLPNATSWVWVP